MISVDKILVSFLVSTEQYIYYLCQRGYVITGVCLSVCLFIWQRDYAKTTELIPTELAGVIGHRLGKSPLNFRADPDFLNRTCKPDTDARCMLETDPQFW